VVNCQSLVRFQISAPSQIEIGSPSFATDLSLQSLTAYRIDGVCFVDGVLCGCLPPTKETDFLALWAILATNNKEARSGAECQAALAVAKP
jgi:hypothetical protein